MKNELYYHRPSDSKELRSLVEQFQGRFQFLVGGDFVPNKNFDKDVLIDIQNLDINHFYSTEDSILMAGLTTLDEVYQGFEFFPDLQLAISLEGGWNLRNSLSIENYLRSADGRSPLLTCMRAFTPKLRLAPELKSIQMDDFMAHHKERRNFYIDEINLEKPFGFAFEYVARSPKDLPIISVAAAKCGDGTIKVSCGGLRQFLDVFAFQDADDGKTKIEALFHNADDEWGSSDYRIVVAGILLGRCLRKLDVDEAKLEAA